MTNRVLRGRNPLTGAVGFYVSKPGFDVRTAGLMQLAFSSDYINPNVVVKGTVTSAPISAAAPYGSGVSNGASATSTIIPYGGTLASIPAAFMIATAPDWTLTLADNNGGITYLQNQWHTSISETCDNNSPVGDYWPGKNLTKDGQSINDHLPIDWYSCRVLAIPFTDHLQILTNCKSTVTIKYLVLQNQV
jgi:hypothetical protein